MPSLATLRLALTAAPWVAILILLGLLIHTNDLKAKWRTNSEHCAEARKADSARRDNQGTTTAGKIKDAGEKQKTADGIAKAIEATPLTPDCRTPKIIMDADI